MIRYVNVKKLSFRLSVLFASIALPKDEIWDIGGIWILRAVAFEPTVIDHIVEPLQNASAHADNLSRCEEYATLVFTTSIIG